MSFWKNRKQGQGLVSIAGADMAVVDDELSTVNPIRVIGVRIYGEVINI